MTWLCAYERFSQSLFHSNSLSLYMHQIHGLKRNFPIQYVELFIAKIWIIKTRVERLRSGCVFLHFLPNAFHLFMTRLFTLMSTKLSSALRGSVHAFANWTIKTPSRMYKIRSSENKMTVYNIKSFTHSHLITSSLHKRNYNLRNAFAQQ